MKISLLAFFIVAFTSVINLNAQIIIQGHVKDLEGIGIEKASIVIYGNESNILAYDYTNNSGDFHITLAETSGDFLIIEANSLGYYEDTDTIVLTPNTKIYYSLFQLKESVEQLNEVVLKSTQKISGNGNITTIQTGAFTNQTEQTVEDVLKKLPGIEVLENGSIKAHGKFIDKLLIDGEDMFANDYQVLSKNLDAKVLTSVQIYDEYQDNPVLAKVVESDRVALNLKLKEELNNIWFGNIQLGLGTKERIKASANIGLLRKKIKFFYFGDYNNLGFKASNQLNGSPSSYNISSGYQEKVIEPHISPLYSIDRKELNFFKEGQSTLNKALINSVGFVKKITPDLELRGTGFLTNDIEDQFFSAKTIYNIGQDPILFTEKSNAHFNNTIGAGELELKYTGGERSYIKNVITYNNEPGNIRNNLVFNDRSIDQSLKKSEYSVYNHFNHSLAINKDQVLHTYIHLGQNKNSQYLDITSPILNKLFALDNDSNIKNLTNDKVSTYGISSNLFSKFGNLRNSIEATYESKREQRENKFLVPYESDLQSIDSLQNELVYDQKNLKIITEFGYTFSEKVEISLGFSIENIKITALSNKKESWFFNPEISLDLRKLKIGRFKISYENSYRTPESSLLLPSYQLRSYRSFIKGVANINFIKRDLYNFYYKWSNELESQAISLRLKYDSSNGNYSTANKIKQEYTLSTYQFVKGGTQVSSSLNYTSYYEKMNISTNFKTTQNWSSIPIQINSTGFKTLKNYNSTYQISGTTYFNSNINFGFDIKLNTSESYFNDITTKTDWQNFGLDITYSLSEQWNASLQNSLYNMEKKSYYFLSSTVDYQPKDSDFSYHLTMSNLTNENKFSNILIDEYVTYNSEIKLLPRYIFVSAKYRF